MEQDAVLQIFRALIPALAGGLGSALIMGWLYKGMEGEAPLKTAGAEIFVYSSRTKKFMTALGLVSLLFAIGPLAMIGLKYDGPDPIAVSHSCYRPREDWLAGLALFVGFGLGGIFCLVDPWKYFIKIDGNGMTVRGLFSGTRFCRWSGAHALKNHASWQMISIHGKNKTGKAQRLWVPYSIGGLPYLVEKLNDHGLFFKEQTEAIEEIKAYLSAHGYSSAIPHKLYLPFLTLWHIPGETAQYIAVLFGVAPDKKTHFEHRTATGSLLDVLHEVKDDLANKRFGYHSEFQKDLANDMEKIIQALGETCSR